MTTPTKHTQGTHDLEPVSASINFVEMEESVLAYWKEIDAFQTSLKKSEGRKPFSFYDGPPFATGLPHYGHILAGTIKDIVTRYAHQTNHHVIRRAGWDCHGLPIEFEIEKMLGIKTRDDVLAFGIDKYNEACRSIVMKYASEWDTVVTRLGRWIDFQNDYKTMDLTFMESVWWVFGELFKKGLIYRGFKVMPYSVGCTTPLSNFEAGENYKEVYDPAITVSFPLLEGDNGEALDPADPQTPHMVAWTTTPWTLPSNLCLCLNPTLDYVKVRDTKTEKVYIVAEARLVEIFKPKKGAKKDDPKGYEVLAKYKGADLKGRRYKPLFDYFVKSDPQLAERSFRIVVDDYVTSDSGTGVVHCAPGFGEDDFRVCLENGIIIKGDNVPCPVDANGRFVDPISDYKGIFVKDADEAIMNRLREDDRLVAKGSIKHQYPHCWRSEMPLIYRAVPSWFVAVEKIKDRLLANNEKTYWVPDFVKTRRFHNWLEDARDWAISRTRYWGTPIPLWVSDDWEEIVCVNSIEELSKLTGKPIEEITDIHRHHIDHLTIPSKRPGHAPLRRVEEVMDCWLESGSMPYAQVHYPFDNVKMFEDSFPADFIAEGLDQCRGWYYTLLVLGTALFDKSPFTNVIVNGLVLAEDGKKMSKRLQNYPDPMHVINSYGADALRLYLINSPVVRAEPLRFKEDGVRDVVRDLFIRWFNAYRFFVQQAISFKKEHGHLFTSRDASEMRSDNVMDQWISSLVQSLIKFVRAEMQAYRLYTVIPKLLHDIDQLTNWYVRMNRKRLKGDGSKDDWYQALCTLYDVLMNVTRTMAPFTPFLTESMYQNLKKLVPEEEREDSVHYLMIPEYDESRVNLQIERSVARMQQVVEVGRTIRDRKGVGLRTPLREVIICHTDEQYLQDVKDLEGYICEELNTKELKATSELRDFINLSASPNNKALGARFKRQLRDVANVIAKFDHDQCVEYVKTGSVTILGEHQLSGDDIIINKTFTGDTSKYESQNTNEKALVILNHVVDEELRQEGMCRLMTSTVQQLRKKAGLVPEDKITVYFELQQDENGQLVRTVVQKYEDLLSQAMKNMSLQLEAAPAESKVIIKSKEDVTGSGSPVDIVLTW